MIEKMAFGEPVGAGTPDGLASDCANGCLNYTCIPIFYSSDDARAAALRFSVNNP
ncbi:MAG: hypothetical protein NTZ17_03895 [Phycisphaerae bacterium]|nr:hypothetical protein [Phycisphaerae bacterium]